MLGKSKNIYFLMISCFSYLHQDLLFSCPQVGQGWLSWPLFDSSRSLCSLQLLISGHGFCEEFQDLCHLLRHLSKYFHLVEQKACSAQRKQHLKEKTVRTEANEYF